MNSQTPRNRCTHCDKPLHPDRETWLELDQRDNTYHDGGVPAEYSQGFFPFGRACARAVLSAGPL